MLFFCIGILTLNVDMNKNAAYFWLIPGKAAFFIQNQPILYDSFLYFTKSYMFLGNVIFHCCNSIAIINNKDQC